MLRVGVIGCGYWGKNYVRVLEELPETKLMGIADKVPSNLEAITRKFPFVETHPDHTGVLHNLGVVAAQAGDPATALDWFDKTIALAPGYSRAYLNRAGALHELERLEEASEAYRTFLAAEPDHYDANFRLALVETALDNHDAALA